jgi:hypothetical protein
MVVLGFQEISESSAKNFIGGSGNAQESIKKWNDNVLKTLKEKSGGVDYVQVANENLVGNAIVMFAKRSIHREITDIALSKVKIGFSGKAGSKGATCLRFLYEDTSFCFLNCHLDSGTTFLD